MIASTFDGHDEMRDPHPLLISVALSLAACAAPEPAGRSSFDLADLVPEVQDLPEWEIVEGPTEYAPGTLYEYLNGGADRYVTSGFQRLLHLRYQLGGDPLASVALDLYDMGDELGAFAIYSAGRPADGEPRAWGAEGYRDGSIACAYRGRLYIHGAADDERQELLTMVEELVRRAASAAPGSTTGPAVLDLLPVTGRVPRSERYVPEHLLGHAFLPGGVIATYGTEAARGELFFTETQDRETADEALLAFREHLSARATVTSRLDLPGSGGFAFVDPLLGSGTVVRSGSWIVGVHGTLDDRARVELIADLLDRLAASAAKSSG
jgi:hypothetical protein